MHPVAVPIELLAPGLVFAAGGFYFVVRAALASLRTDVNGVGRKIGQSDERAASNHFRMSILMLTFCEPEQREKIANWLLR
jgi:hypothetical protein